MDKFMVGLRSLAQEPRSGDGGGGGGRNSSGGLSDSFAGSPNASDQPRILIRAPAGRVVSLSTCTKICLVSFTIGMFVGFTLKRRLRRWAAKLLKRMKDD